MATQTIEFGAPAGQTVTARLFAAGSDVVVATATATARTNATGIYTAAFADLTPGLYRLIGTNAAGTLLCQWWTLTESATATYPVYEVPPSVVVDGVWNALLSSYTTNGSFGARIMRTDSASAGNGAKVTGAGHVAADIHELQPQVIGATHFAAGAIDANALAADAVTEVQAGLGTLDNQRYLLSILAGATSNAGTAGETYVITIGGSTYTVTYAGLDATGNRGTTAFAKT